MKHKLKKGLKLKLESTMKSIKKADEEIQENNQNQAQLNSNRGLLSPNYSARLPMKLESIEEERKVELSVNESQEKIDAKQTAIECHWLMKNDPDIQISSNQS